MYPGWNILSVCLSENSYLSHGIYCCPRYTRPYTRIVLHWSHPVCRGTLNRIRPCVDRSSHFPSRKCCFRKCLKKFVGLTNVNRKKRISMQYFVEFKKGRCVCIQSDNQFWASRLNSLVRVSLWKFWPFSWHWLLNQVHSPLHKDCPPLIPLGLQGHLEQDSALCWPQFTLPEP